MENFVGVNRTRVVVSGERIYLALHAFKADKRERKMHRFISGHVGNGLNTVGFTEI